MSSTLRTDRLTLRALEPSDATQIAHALNDFSVVRWLTPIPFPYGIADAKAWLDRMPQPVAGRGNFAIELEGAGLIGTISLVSELGYWLDRRYWGRGFASEAARAVLDWHYAGPDGDIVQSGAQRDNRRSIGVLTKLGFVETVESLRFVRSLGRDIAHVDMALTRQAYLAGNGVAA
jgi:RimJ/RimL family protein N-acetyltransferase